MQLKFKLFSFLMTISINCVLAQANQNNLTMSITKTSSKTIVFVHGLFMNPHSWDHWIAFFEAKGYHCYAPAYAFHQGDPASLRSDIDTGLGTLNFAQVIDSLVAFIDNLPEKPILIGHSMGGLAVQKLIALDKGIAGICIDPAPPKGVFSFKWSFLKANLPTINPLKGNSVCLPSVKWFHYAFCNTLTMEQTQSAYNEFVVPESRNIPRSSIGKDGKIIFNLPHKPLLFIAGEVDNIVPASLIRKNFNAYKDTAGIKTFKSFAGRGHFLCGEPGWEEIAAYISQWINGHN
jgi:pimeloyl-ACP methyl ester carboxylesterase